MVSACVIIIKKHFSCSMTHVMFYYVMFYYCNLTLLLLLHNTVTGRYDLRLPDYVIADLKLEERLQPILSRLASIMGHPKPQLRTHNVVFVPVGTFVYVCMCSSSRSSRLF